VLASDEPPSNPDFRDANWKQQQQQQQQHYSSSPAVPPPAANQQGQQGGGGGLMSLVQMSTSSTERIVRQLEVKLDRMSDMISSGSMINGGTPTRRRRGGDNDGSNGPELLAQLGSLLTEGEAASGQVEQLQDKVSVGVVLVVVYFCVLCQRRRRRRSIVFFLLFSFFFSFFSTSSSFPPSLELAFSILSTFLIQFSSLFFLFSFFLFPPPSLSLLSLHSRFNSFKKNIPT